MKTAARWLFILCLPVLLATASVTAAANCPALYQYGFAKYDVGQTTGLAPSELDKAANGLIAYFNSGEEFIDLTVEKDGQPFTLFNEREVAHLKDVKGLFRLVWWLLWGMLAYALAFAAACLFWWRQRKILGWGLVGGGGLTLLLMIVLGIAALIDFDGLFLQFHLLSFANDLWLLNPATDYLIMLFPQGFWFDAALYCVLGAAGGAIILGGVGWWLKRRS